MPSVPLKYNPQTGNLEFLTTNGRQIVRNTVTLPAPTASSGALVSNPPAGCKKITNIYVDADGKLITVFTP